MLLASAPQPISSPSNEILAVLPARTPCSHFRDDAALGSGAARGSICDCRTCSFKRGMPFWPVQRGQSVIEITIRVRFVEQGVEITEVT